MNVDDDVKSTAAKFAQKASEVADKAQDKFGDAKASFKATASNIKDRADAVGDFVQGTPWQAVGIALLVGLAVGLLVKNSRSNS